MTFANDWHIKRCIQTSVATLLVFLVSTVFAAIDLSIPGLRQVSGFVLLTFIPGILILRIIKAHELGMAKSLLYTVGLSLAFNMFLGLLVNFICPLFGISMPLTTLPLTIVWSAVLLLLSLLAYKVDNQFSRSSTPPTFGRVLCSPLLFLFLLLLLSIIGAGLVNCCGNNLVLLIFLALVCLVPIITTFTGWIHERLFPLTVYVVALALLLHSSLIGAHIIGKDIFDEYYFYELASQNGIWDMAVPGSYNAMLSVTILPTVFTELPDVPGELLFKFINPFLLSLTLVAAYLFFRTQFNARKAFLAVFLIMSMDFFFSPVQGSTDMRRLVGLLFFALLLLLVNEKTLSTLKIRILGIIFSAGLIVSYYTLSYLYIVIIFICLVALYAMKKRSSAVTTTSALSLFGVMCIGWYLIMADSSVYDSAVQVGRNAYSGITTEFLEFGSRQSGQMAEAPALNWLHQSFRACYYIALLLICIGTIRILFQRIKRDTRAGLSDHYISLIIANLLVLAAIIAGPHLADSLITNRFLFFSLLVLAPMCIVGIETISWLLLSGLRPNSLPWPSRYWKGVTLAFLLSFFLFNSGFVFEVMHDQSPNSVALSLHNVRTTPRHYTPQSKIDMCTVVPTKQEVASAIFLSNKMSTEANVYATVYDLRIGPLKAFGMIPKERTIGLTLDTRPVHIRDSYIYLGYVNTQLGYGTIPPLSIKELTTEEWWWDMSAILPLFDSCQKTYSNGVSEIWSRPG